MKKPGFTGPFLSLSRCILFYPTTRFSLLSPVCLPVPPLRRNRKINGLGAVPPLLKRGLSLFARQKPSLAVLRLLASHHQRQCGSGQRSPWSYALLSALRL